MTNEKPKALIVPVDLVQRLLENLTKQSWQKVNGLIQSLAACTPTPPDAPPDVKDPSSG